VDKKTGNIETKQAFNNYQLHLEWLIPSYITGEGQARGNSGLFLASIGKGDLGYELQILDGYNNKTYTNGMVGSIYKQTTPLVNAAKKPGEWQTYDIVWTAPTFNADSSLKTPAKVTVFYNGVLVQNNFELKGPTQYVGQPAYRQAHGASPIKLQSHGDKSEPISFRNIWIREL
uniref:3-keto-disaccharide hydrolase n=1 Tax=Pedobacter sp. TaxID=1411316 RepID=UPI003D7F60A9